MSSPRPRGRRAAAVPLHAAPGSRLLDLVVGLPMGGVSLAELNQVIEMHGVETSMERLKRLPNKAGEWDYASAELQLWVSREGYRPLLRDLKGLEEDGFSVIVTPILAIQETPSEARKELGRPRVNGWNSAPRGAKPGGQAVIPRAEKREAEEAEP